MASQPTTTADDAPPTPADVREQAAAFREAHVDDEPVSLLAAALTPRSRVRILDALLGAGGEALTVATICERAAIDRGTFTRQKLPLLDLGVMVQGEPVANAKTYRIVREHPLAQLLAMSDQVLRFGTAADLLDERFVGTPGDGYDPGEHPADDRE